MPLFHLRVMQDGATPDDPLLPAIDATANAAGGFKLPQKACYLIDAQDQTDAEQKALQIVQAAMKATRATLGLSVGRPSPIDIAARDGGDRTDVN